MKISKLFLVLGVVLAMGLMAAPALAATAVDTDSKLLDDGVTTVTWDSSFVDLAYVGGATTMLINWTVSSASGTADYNGNWHERGITPRAKNDPAEGYVREVSEVPNTSATFSATFTELHYSEDESIDMGNAHFTIRLDVDIDGDTITDQTIRCGVNCHVETPV